MEKLYHFVREFLLACVRKFVHMSKHLLHKLFIMFVRMFTHCHGKMAMA